MKEAVSGKKVANQRFSNLLSDMMRWPGLQRNEILLLFLSLFLVWFAAISAIKIIEYDYEERVASELQTLLQSTDQAIHLWSRDRKAVAENLATEENIVAATHQLLQSAKEKQALLASPAQKTLRSLFGSFLRGGNLRGFFIIDRDNISLASSRDSNVGDENLLKIQADVMERLWQGEVVMSRVQISDVPLPEQTAIGTGSRDLTMFVGSPIRDENGEVIALLTLRIDPNETLFALLNQSGMGKTGEAYIFDHQGLMLSPIRFREDLISMGLINLDQSNVGRVYVRDHSLKQSAGLNRMASGATQGTRGVDVSGYSGYHGKKVVGAWQWEQELDVGLVVEQGYDEAYAIYYKVQTLIYIACLVATVALLLMGLSFGRGRKQVRESQSQLSAVVENAVDSIVVIDHYGIIQSVNPEVEQAFGYKASDLIGKNVSMLMPEPHRSAHDGYISRFMQTGEAHVIGSGREVEAVRADGTLFPAELVISKFELESGIHFAGILRDLTLHKQADVELDAERRFSERVLNSLMSHVAVLDETGEIIFVNQAWRSFAHENGMPKDQDPVGMNYLQVVKQSAGNDSDEAETVATHLSDMLEGKEDSFSIEYPCHAPGRQRWLQMQSSSFESRGRRLIVTSHSDITERRLAEESLQKEKDVTEEINKTLSLTQAALNRSGIGEFWMNARTGAIFKVNERVCEYLGYTQDEMRELSVVDWAPEYPPKAYAKAVELLREEGGGRLELMHKAKDGTLIPVEVIIEYLKAEDNEEDDALIVFSIDITERKRVEDELRMKSLVAAETDNGVVVTGLDQRIKWVNPGFSAITGYAFDEVIGKKPGEFLQGAETEKEAVRLLSDAIRKQERVETDITNYGKDGISYVVHIEIMPVRDKSGEVVEFIALERDVTKQRHAEAEVKAAKEAAEQANRAKSSFLAAMSHEIRTPLNGVVGTIDLLEHTQLESNQRDMVRTARDSSLTLMGVIEDILDFSKIEAGRLDLEHSPLCLQRVVEGCVESLQPLAAKKNVDLLVFCDPAIPEIMGDSVRVRQILFNLAGNAIKFSSALDGRQGKVEVNALLDGLKDGKANIRLQLRDNGIGIAPDVQERLFKPFIQAESSTTRRFGGTGLGLIISKRLTEIMGGHIELESRPDEGSLFSVILTMETAPEHSAKQEVELAGLKLLMVEGNYEANRIIESYLSYAGAEVISAAPADAIARFKTLMDGEGEILLVIESQGQESIVNQLREVARKLAAGRKEVRFLIIGRGRRRYVRPCGEDSMMLDINGMRRSTLINAVASLAGLVSPEMGDQEIDYSYITDMPTVEEARARGRLLLVAEDNETNRNVIRQQLGMLGYASRMAENGLQALKMWREDDDYAMLLTDCHMPEMDGYTLASTIRAEESGERHLPIIAITADALKGTAEKCLAAGMDDYVTKPMQIPALQTVLKKWSPEEDSDEVVAVQPTEAAGSESIDSGALALLLGTDDAETLAKFYTDFLVTGSEIVEQIRATHAEGQIKQVGKLAHKLKSSAHTVGANALADCCFALQQAGKAEDRLEVDLQMNRFNMLFKDVHEWMEQYSTRG